MKKIFIFLIYATGNQDYTNSSQDNKKKIFFFGKCLNEKKEKELEKQGSRKNRVFSKKITIH